MHRLQEDHIDLDALPRTREAVMDRGRLLELRESGLLDAPDEESLDRITGLTERLLNVPIAMITLVDRDRQVFKSQVGLTGSWAEDRESPLTHSFCQYAVAMGDRLVVENARESSLRDNPAVDEQGVVAYAGEPLSTARGHVLGTLCVIDHEPREWTKWELEVLGDLSLLAMTEIDYRLRTRALRGMEALAEALQTPISELGDAVRSMASLTDRAGNPRIERLSSLLRARFGTVESARDALMESLTLSHRAVGRQLLTTVNLGERLLRAGHLASVAQHSNVRIEILDRPLPVRCDAQELDTALAGLLMNAMKHAGDDPIEATLCRDDFMAQLEVRCLEPMPVSELLRVVSAFDVATAGSPDGGTEQEASISVSGRVTTATSDQVHGTTGPDGSRLIVSLPLVDAG